MEGSLPFFNSLADKKISIPWGNPFLWLTGIGFSLLTGLIAGSYPALYLSSFQPIKVLKGVFRAGRLAALPRKVLVVTQFTVSITLIIGTVIVFRQIQFARNRPVGYDRNGLLMIQMHTKDIYNPCLIAIPIAWYLLHQWLLQYEYRTGISWWIFVAAGIGAILITLLTVSYQSIKASLMNPVKSLKTE